jgi:acylphosphatase
MEPAAVKVTVSGRVQGVGYRYFVFQHARQLDLKGYVKNLAGGDVEVYVEGDKPVIMKLLKLLQRGPGFAYVTDLDLDWSDPSDSYKEFDITY